MSTTTQSAELDGATQAAPLSAVPSIPSIPTARRRYVVAAFSASRDLGYLRCAGALAVFNPTLDADRAHRFDTEEEALRAADWSAAVIDGEGYGDRMFVTVREVVV